VRRNVPWLWIVFGSLLALALGLGFYARRPHRASELGSEGGVTIEEDQPSAYPRDLMRAREAVAHGRMAEAEEIYRQLVAKDAQSPSGYVGVGSCCLFKGDADGARKWYDQALARNPKCLSARIGRGSSYLAQANPAEAIKEYEAVLALKETVAEAHYGLAKGLLELHRRPEALRHAERFKQLAPDSQYIRDLEILLWTAR